jgi:hypothetical protein
LIPKAALAVYPLLIITVSTTFPIVLNIMIISNTWKMPDIHTKQGQENSKFVFLFGIFVHNILVAKWDIL